jgi:hypothetical protein
VILRRQPPRDPRSDAVVAKQVVHVKVTTGSLQSEPDVSETYNPQAKLLRMSESKEPHGG